MESSSVPVVFKTRQTLVVLDRCSDVGPADLSERVRGWRLDGRERFLTQVKLQKCTVRENTHTSNICVCSENFSPDRCFSCVIVDMAVYCRRLHCKLHVSSHV